MSKVEYIYIEDDSQVPEAVDFLLSCDRLGYDTEAQGLKLIGGFSKLLLMQVGTEDLVYVFDPRRIDTEPLRPVLESPDILKIAHNAKYDYQSTKIGTGISLCNIFDTMLAQRLLTSGLIEDGKGGFVPTGFRDKNKKRWPYKSLAHLTQFYLGITLDKTVRNTFIDHPYKADFSTAQLQYAADDVVLLPALCDILSAKLLEKDLIDTALLEFQFVVPASEMEINGVCLDTKQWLFIIEEAKRQAVSLADEMSVILSPLSEQNTLFGECAVNIKSPEQLLDAFHKLGFNALENTDEKALKDVDHELAKLVLRHRGYNKLISTYGNAILRKINRNTGRLHFVIDQLGADTGRVSSRNPNIQNIPNDSEAEDVKISFRDCFVAPEGSKILTADYSQCELRILAELSRDKGFLEIFHSGEDLHIITSQQVFGYADSALDSYLKLKKEDRPGVDLLSMFAEEQVSDYKLVSDYRNKTKTINFGIVYGLSAWSLSERFKIPQSESEGILESYFKTYSGIKRWLNSNARETIANRYSKTILGRKKFFELADPADEEKFRRSKGAVRRQGNNQVIQGTNADITKEALIKLNEEYKSIPGAKILFPVHDEIVSEAPDAVVEQVAGIKAEVMKQAFHRFVKTVPVGKDDVVSVSIANHWAK